MASNLPTANFPRLERQGWLLGLSGGQLLVLLLALIFLMRAMFTTDFVLIVTTFLFVCLPLTVFGITSWKRRALTTTTWEWCVWIMRKNLGQTNFKIRPETPRSAMAFGLPGVLGARISVHKTAFGQGAMLWDARARTATAVLRCTTSSFNLASEDSRAGRAAAFARLCAQLVKHEGVARVATYARTRPASAAELRDYYHRKTTERHAGANASQWADAQYRDLLDSEMVRSKAVVGRDVLLAITISERAARAMIKAGGGRKRGMSYVMAQEVVAVQNLLNGTGVDSTTWLDTAGISEVVRTAFDPGAVDAIDNRRTYPDLNPLPTEGPVHEDAAGPMYIREERDYVETDSGMHRTFWVAEWPRTDVEVGFLEPLVASGQYPHTFTQVFTPIPTHKALRDIRSARAALESQFDMRQRMGRPITAEMHAQGDDLDERETEITAGFGAVRFTGYLTVSGTDEEQLSAATSEATIAGAGLDLRSLKGQQSAAFTAAMLPVGWGLK